MGNSMQDLPLDERVEYLQSRLKELKRRWPAHTTPPGMMVELDELEEALEAALQEQKKAQDAEA